MAFDGIGTCVDDSDDADRFVRAVWGEAQFASLRRSPGQIIEHRLPSGIRRLQQFRYMPVTALGLR